MDSTRSQGQERNRSDAFARRSVRFDVRTEGLAVMTKNDVAMLEKLCCIGDVLDELKHNLKVTPGGTVEITYMVERLEQALNLDTLGRG